MLFRSPMGNDQGGMPCLEEEHRGYLGSNLVHISEQVDTYQGVTHSNWEEGVGSRAVRSQYRHISAQMFSHQISQRSAQADALTQHDHIGGLALAIPYPG